MSCLLYTSLYRASGTYDLCLSYAGFDGRNIGMLNATCRREKSQVTFDGEIRPRIERRGFDLTFPHGPHDGQARIPSLLRRPGLFVRGRSSAEIFPGELVLLLGQFQRIGLLPLGVELGLQGRDLLFQCFDLGIACLLYTSRCV